MNQFLKIREEVSEATKYLKENNLVASGLDCKNWEIFSVIHSLFYLEFE